MIPVGYIFAIRMILLSLKASVGILVEYPFLFCIVFVIPWSHILQWMVKLSAILVASQTHLDVAWRHDLIVTYR